MVNLSLDNVFKYTVFFFGRYPLVMQFYDTRSVTNIDFTSKTNNSWYKSPITAWKIPFERYDSYLNDWFDTEGDIVLDSTVLVVDEDNITDCGVNDDQEMIED